MRTFRWLFNYSLSKFKILWFASSSSPNEARVEIPTARIRGLFLHLARLALVIVHTSRSEFFGKCAKTLRSSHGLESLALFFSEGSVPFSLWRKGLHPNRFQPRWISMLQEGLSLHRSKPREMFEPGLQHRPSFSFDNGSNNSSIVSFTSGSSLGARWELYSKMELLIALLPPHRARNVWCGIHAFFFVFPAIRGFLVVATTGSIPTHRIGVPTTFSKENLAPVSRKSVFTALRCERTTPFAV